METIRLAHALGAEIRGIDITANPSEREIKAIRSIWHKHHVIVFRDIKWSPAAHIAFSRRFGDLDDHKALPNESLPGYPELLEVTNIPKDGKPSPTRATGRNWHSDFSYTSQPAAYSMLYCTKAPSVGGDTMFCNMAQAYNELSPKLRGILEDLHAVFDFNLVAGARYRTANNLAELTNINPPIAHPAVRTHDESGVRALYISERVSHFDGMTKAESAPLIQYLCMHATRHENIYRHTWRVGDLICWDNRTVMHLALGDFSHSEQRHMLRTTIKGARSGYQVSKYSARE